MSPPESVARTANDFYSQCIAGNIEDPGSYSLTRIVRLSKNQCGSIVSCNSEKSQPEMILLVSHWTLLVKWVVDKIHSRTGGVGPDVQLGSKRWLGGRTTRRKRHSVMLEGWLGPDITVRWGLTCRSTRA